VGSFRDIRVMRGGKKVFDLDLYPLRAEGLGNPNVALQNGDTVFVPLAENMVLLEGAFQRVVTQLPSVQSPGDLSSIQKDLALNTDPFREQRERTLREIKAIESQLAMQPGLVMDRAASTQVDTATDTQTGKALGQKDRAALEDRLSLLQRQLLALQPPAGDHRLQLDPATGNPVVKDEEQGLPDWLRLWDRSGNPPVMQFELKSGETVADAFHFAGGFAPEAGEGALTLRHRDSSGVIHGLDVPLVDASKVGMHRGDVLLAPIRRERTGPVVTLVGWVRVPGTFARTEGLRIGDLLRRESQLLPDTYRARGEVLHTALDGTTRLQSFNVDQALGGDAANNLLLEDRDRVELFRLEDLRLPLSVSVTGPVARPGMYAFHDGMRASDLVFRAGVLQKDADRLHAELAHAKEGESSEVVRLDLTRLLSTETASPTALMDDAVNPRIRPDDQLSFFAKPDFKVHRVVRVSGQVLRPGTYTLDQDHAKLSELIKRAGGMTPEAMPKAGIFLRAIGGVVSQMQSGAAVVGVSKSDPTGQGINDILERLSETKRQPLTGQLQKNPILHALTQGDLNRLVVNFDLAIKGNEQSDVELQDGDEIIIPRRVDAAYVVGETASPFAVYKVQDGMKVSDLLKLAGGLTRNADSSGIRLLKADGRIIDTWVEGKPVEPGDAVLVPQRFRRDTNWQENLQALTPLALILNALKL
jgi:protein involved in polysaccharide export with SLBB domain